MIPPDLERLTPEAETAEWLHMSRDWLARQVRAGRFECTRLGNRRFYTAKQIADIIAKSSTAAQQEEPAPVRRRRRTALREVSNT